jgi:hypothetical protein
MNIFKIQVMVINLENLKEIRVMVFNTTFNTISVLSWQLVLLVDDTGVPGENYRPDASH